MGVVKHGYARDSGFHPLYRVWDYMISRCYRKSHKAYHNYGGRGIRVCDEWRHHPEVFVEWASSHGWQKGLDLDRIDNNGNYSPDNCRFVTRSENLKNRRRGIRKNKSGLPCGVQKQCQKFKAQIGINGVITYLGVYDTPEEAHAAFQKALELHKNGQDIPKVIRGPNKSGLPFGVSKHHGRFAACFWYNKKSLYLGSFETPEEASLEYQSALKEFKETGVVTKKKRVKARVDNLPELVYKDGNSYYVKIKRKGHPSFHCYAATVEEAVAARDKWLAEHPKSPKQ